jgi:hypothetical protein
MFRCTKCGYPATKPGITLKQNGTGSAICNACANVAKKKLYEAYHWEKRVKELVELVKNPSAAYDCIIPVSGGKDSYFQSMTIKKLGLRALLVNARTDDLTPVGRKNLDNLRVFGFPMIEIATDQIERNRIAGEALRRCGDISLAEHMTIFTIPVIIAENLGIKSIIWGENPQAEYGGLNSEADTLDHKWLLTHGGLLGQNIKDYGIIDKYWYTYPEKVSSTGYFLGQFVYWDSVRNGQQAVALGMKTAEPGPYLNNFENLDNCQTGIHDMFKLVKYGYSRWTDQQSYKLRHGHTSLTKAKKIVNAMETGYHSYDALAKHKYFGKTGYEICSGLGISHNEYLELLEKFTHPQFKAPGGIEIPIMGGSAMK